jgi:autotransporter-associated beta strand protein
MKIESSLRLRHFLLGSTLAAAIGSAGAQTTFQWNGTTNTTFGTATNWSPTAGGLTAGPATTSGTSNSRLNVNNTDATRPLTYSATQGTTIYSGGAGRALVIASGTAGNMVITGGTFDSSQPTDDVLVNGAFAGSLTINGGNYINTSGGSEIFLMGLNAGATVGAAPTLNIESGNFTAGRLQFGQNSGIGAGGIVGVINLNGGVLSTKQFHEQGALNNFGDTGIALITSTVNFNGGTLRALETGTIMKVNAVDNAVVQANGAIIDTNTFNTTIAKSLTAGTGSGGLTKQGAGTLTLSAANTYTGATTVSTGTLALSDGGLIANSSTINVASAATLSVTGVTPTTFTVGATQTLTGAGTILATGKTVVANGTLSPGNSPGTLTQDGGALRLGLNGDLNWQIHNAAGTAGSGYDTVNLINGATLDLSLLTAANSYNINLWSLSGLGPDVNGNATGFDNTLNYSWTLFSTGTAITGFDATAFAINTGAFNGTNGFSNALGGGAFSVNLADGNTDLVLSFTAIPEPSAALLGGIGMLCLLRRRR